MDKKEEKDFQQKYMQYNLYKQQAQGLLNEMGLLNQTSQNMNTAREVLVTLEKTKDKTEILIPIGGNTFLKASINDTNNVLFGIGSDVVLSKPVSDAIATISEQLENLKKSGDELAGKMKELEDVMRVLEPELQKMMMKAQKEHEH
ncbi:MAG: prefoldin subunit alpha [archaeon]